MGFVDWFVETHPPRVLIGGTIVLSLLNSPRTMSRLSQEPDPYRLQGMVLGLIISSFLLTIILYHVWLKIKPYHRRMMDRGKKADEKSA